MELSKSASNNLLVIEYCSSLKLIVDMLIMRRPGTSSNFHSPFTLVSEDGKSTSQLVADILEAKVIQNIQGGLSGCTLPLVGIKTKVLSQY